MPLETGTYISDLVSSNPAHTDSLNNADAHLRLIKAALKNTLEGVPEALTQVDDSDNWGLVSGSGTADLPAYSFSDEKTLGLYRPSTGIIAVTGGRLINVAPVGSIHMFGVEPTGLGKGGTGTGHDWLELDGSTWNVADFPDLAEHFGTSGSTFTLWDMTTAGRFPRSRTSSVIAGTTQASQNKTHTHGVSGWSGNESTNHTHFGSGTTGSMNRNATHAHSYRPPGPTNTTTPGGNFGAAGAYTGADLTGTANTDHEHSFSFTTGTQSTYHQHFVNITSDASGSSEARPEALSLIFCIKT